MCVYDKGIPVAIPRENREAPPPRARVAAARQFLQKGQGLIRRTGMRSSEVAPDDGGVRRRTYTRARELPLPRYSSSGGRSRHLLRSRCAIGTEGELGWLPPCVFSSDGFRQEWLILSLSGTRQVVLTDLLALSGFKVARSRCAKRAVCLHLLLVAGAVLRT